MGLKARRELHSRARRDALVLTLVTGTIAAGAAAFQQSREERVLREATSGPFWLRMEDARWVRDGMLHPGAGPFAASGALMPGLPDDGVHRLNVELTVRNDRSQAALFDFADLSLESPSGNRWKAERDEESRVRLPGGHSYAAVVRFDVPEDEPGPLSLYWRHGGEQARMLSVLPPTHADAGRKLRPTAWPLTVESLPPGRAAAGRALFARYACASCHGELGVPGSNSIGPSLEGLTLVAGQRERGKSAAQYVFESLLTPDAFIAPRCARGAPCLSPSVMPSYRQSLSEQQMADLVAFLMHDPVAEGSP